MRTKFKFAKQLNKTTNNGMEDINLQIKMIQCHIQLKII